MLKNFMALLTGSLFFGSITFAFLAIVFRLAGLPLGDTRAVITALCLSLVVAWLSTVFFAATLLHEEEKK